ncbi:uncharacterized protein LOC102073150 isoform X2 [Zonotrichia albicollis]|uniref:uncharacterized protein LOC102073150 isoform X2 n=1 Tax=Zonotrichia albicollis TaxID=44394 RepID=UPI003D80FB3B
MPTIVGKALGQYGQIKVRPRNCKGYRYICSRESFEGVRIQILRPQTLRRRCGREGQLPSLAPCARVPGTAGSAAMFFRGPLPSWAASRAHLPEEDSSPWPLSPLAPPPASACRDLLNLPSASVGIVLLITTAGGGAGGDAWHREGHTHPSRPRTQAPAASAWDASSPRHTSPSLVPVSSIPEAHRLSSDSSPCLERIRKESPLERHFSAADGCLFWGGTGEVSEWEIPGQRGGVRYAAVRRGPAFVALLSLKATCSSFLEWLLLFFPPIREGLKKPLLTSLRMTVLGGRLRNGDRATGSSSSRQDRRLLLPSFRSSEKGRIPPFQNTYAGKVFAIKLPPFGKELYAVYNVRSSGAASSNHLVTSY